MGIVRRLSLYLSLAMGFGGLVFGCDGTELTDITPPATISNLQAQAGDTQVALSWTNPSDADFAGVIIRRSVTAYPTSITDGESVYDGTGTSHTDTGLTNDTLYYYSAFTYDEVPNYSTAAQASATPVAPDTTAPGAVTNFAAQAGNEEVVLSWTNPSDADLAGVMIRRSTSAFPTSATEGDEVYDGSAETATDTGLTNGTLYYYSAFAYDGAGNHSAVAEASATPEDTTAPAMVMDFLAQASDGQVVLSWTNPSDSDFAGVTIRRSAVSFPLSPTAGEAVYDGTNETVTDTGLTNDTTYYYTAFTYDEVPNHSNPAQASAMPFAPDLTPPGSVTGFFIEVGFEQLHLMWTNPTDDDFAGVLIVRKEGGFPADETDGTLIYDGIGSQFTDTGLTNGTTYFYAAYAYDVVGNLANAAQASDIPSVGFTVSGTISYAVGVTGTVHVYLMSDPDDMSTIRYQVQLNDVGAYQVEDVVPGDYYARAFEDSMGIENGPDGLMNRGEPQGFYADLGFPDFFTVVDADVSGIDITLLDDDPEFYVEHLNAMTLHQKVPPGHEAPAQVFFIDAHIGGPNAGAEFPMVTVQGPEGTLLTLYDDGGYTVGADGQPGKAGVDDDFDDDANCTDGQGIWCGTDEPDELGWWDSDDQPTGSGDDQFQDGSSRFITDNLSSVLAGDYLVSIVDPITNLVTQYRDNLPDLTFLPVPEKLQPNNMSHYAAGIFDYAWDAVNGAASYHGRADRCDQSGCIDEEFWVTTNAYTGQENWDASDQRHEFRLEAYDADITDQNTFDVDKMSIAYTTFYVGGGTLSGNITDETGAQGQIYVYASCIDDQGEWVADELIPINLSGPSGTYSIGLPDCLVENVAAFKDLNGNRHPDWPDEPQAGMDYDAGSELVIIPGDDIAGPDFTIKVPVYIVLTAPADEATNVSATPTFAWEDVDSDDVLSYILGVWLVGNNDMSMPEAFPDGWMVMLPKTVTSLQWGNTDYNTLLDTIVATLPAGTTIAWAVFGASVPWDAPGFDGDTDIIAFPQGFALNTFTVTGSETLFVSGTAVIDEDDPNFSTNDPPSPLFLGLLQFDQDMEDLVVVAYAKLAAAVSYEQLTSELGFRFYTENFLDAVDDSVFVPDPGETFFFATVWDLNDNILDGPVIMPDSEDAAGIHRVEMDGDGGDNDMPVEGELPFGGMEIEMTLMDSGT